MIFLCLNFVFIFQRKKERRNCLVVLGTENGDVLAIDISAGAMKWRSTGTFPGYVVSYVFFIFHFSYHKRYIEERIVLRKAAWTIFKIPVFSSLDAVECTS